MTTVQHQRIIGVILLFIIILGAAMLLIRSAQDGVVQHDVDQKPLLAIESNYVEIIEPNITESNVNLEPDTVDLVEVEIKQDKSQVNIAPKIETAEIIEHTSGSEWVIQLASFSVRDNAEALKSQLKNLGYKAVIQTIQGNKGKIFRVRLDAISDKNKAYLIANELNTKLNLSAQILQE